MKKTVSALLTAALLCSLTAVALPSQATATTYDAGYAGLGDSIARGYGNLQGKAAVDMIGSMLLDKGHAKNARVTYKNLAQDGDRSDHLLRKLKNSPEVTQAVANSNFVTISIGGNNVMIEMGRQCAVAVGIDPDSVSDPLGAVTDYLSSNPVTGSAKVLSHVNSSAFKATMAEVIAGFRADMPQIIKEIRKLSPNARIIVQTLYVPTKFIFLSSFLDNYISQLNAVITELSSSYSYRVADMYTVFKNYKGSGDVTFTNVMGGLFDPHPTATGQKLIFDTVYPMVSDLVDALPTRANTPSYGSYGNLKANMKFGFDFDSSAFPLGQSIFASGNTAANYITVGSTGTRSQYDLSIVTDNHIKGLAFDMYQDFDMSPITLKLNSAVNGTSFLSGTKVIPSDSTDHGMLMYVDTTGYRGAAHMQLQWNEEDADGSSTRRGLRANAEAYAQDANNNFTVPVTITGSEYLMLPANYQGYIAIPFNSFKSIWNTTDINFAVDLKNVSSIMIYRKSDANGGRLVLDEFNFYGRTLTGDALTPQAGQSKTTGMPTNLMPLFNFEDNMFVQGQSIPQNTSYKNLINKYLSGPALNSPPQYELKATAYEGASSAGLVSTKGLAFSTLSNQSASGQFSNISLNTRQDLGLYEKLVKRGNFVSSSSESDGLAFYIDLTHYDPNTFSLNLIWHETDCDANGMPIYAAQNGGIMVEQTTSRNVNEAYGTVEGVHDNGTSTQFALSGDYIDFGLMPDGSKFKGWVKVPFAAFKTCWNSSDVNGAVDFNDLFGIDMYFGSYPSRTGTIYWDDFCFYGPAFAGLAAQSPNYIAPANVLNVDFAADGSVVDWAGNATFSKVGGVQVANTAVTHKGVNYTVPAMNVTASGQGIMASLPMIADAESQRALYENGFTVEAFGVNRVQSGEQGFLSSAQNGGWGLFSESNKAKFDVCTVGYGYTSSFSASTLPTSELVHIAGVYDFANGKLSVYINGSLSNIVSITGGFAYGGGAAFNKVALGGDVDYYGDLTQSLMTNFSLVGAKIYSEPLNGQQIRMAYSQAVADLS